MYRFKQFDLNLLTFLSVSVLVHRDVALEVLDVVALTLHVAVPIADKIIVAAIVDLVRL